MSINAHLLQFVGPLYLSLVSFFLCENDAPNEKRIISTQEVCGYQQKMYNFPVADDLA